GRGIGQDQLIEVLVEQLRQLMLVAACGPDSELIELSEDAKPAAVELARRFDAAGLVHMIALCENLQRHAKASSNPRALLDATVVRLALAEKMADVGAVLSGAAAVLPRGVRTSGGGEKKKLAAADPPTLPADPPPTPRVDPTDLPGVWSAVLDTVGRSNAAAWMDHFRLATLDTDAVPAVAHLRPTTGFVGGVHHVATGPRLRRVGDTLTQLLGRPVRVEAAEAKPPEASTPHPDAGLKPAPANGRADAVDRREALGLPLVRDVLEVFPDASLIDARRRPNHREE
ncbi:MAG: hypothetical protein AAF800_13685, partial [Planctomycetota bacterium]